MKLISLQFLFTVVLFNACTLSAIAQTKVNSWDNLPKIKRPVFKTDTFNIVKFGAIADGYTLNTKSINQAIVTCSNKGGGVVLIPSGYWLTGPVELKSNVNLHLEKNALLQFSSDFNQYQIIAGNYEGKPSARNQSPIMGINLENVAITGAGTIDGNGDAWRMVGRDKLTEGEWKKKIGSGGLISGDGKKWFPSEKTKKADLEKRSVVLEAGKRLSDFEDIKDYLRPNLIVFTNCSKVLLEGVTFQNSPAWNIHPLLCTDLTLRNIVVKNPDYAQNGDGVDVESCKNVLIEGSVFDVGDDAICIKSGKDEEGRKRNIPTENVIIRNNKVYAGHGGFVVGSEMSGGARNIFISDCSFMGTDKGIRFKTTRGRGGIVEKIYIRNLNMVNIVDEAIFFDMYYWTKPPEANQKQEVPKVSIETPQFRDIFIDNVICNGANIGVFIRGLPEMAVRNIKMQNLFLNARKAIEIKDASDIEITNSVILTKEKMPLVYVESSKNISLDGVKFNPGAGVLFDINGDSASNIQIKNSGLAKEAIKAVFMHGANEISFKK
ncbi:MAG: glycoside hydrolase family 28 protein [Candidatus Pedobacter colombiensis]|uniref:Glycoside hydrolase family 28 protein n=1 Tax=Candidatus Pedobacter colombiensis TaxID=3121371 RepID=A0AAJ5W8P9_9SPHI|nr:glycoside hydrolase family 28 protein [Pedobacter sp.]WEK18492.1 MAG: glycoside hydrolase family 28 protein [Pedobacter sp.]